MFAAELRWIGHCEQVGCWDAGYRWWIGTCVPRHYTREHRAPSSCTFENSASCHFCISVLVQQSRLSHPVTDSRPKFFSYHPWSQFNIFPEPVSGMIEPSAYFPLSRSLESNAQLLLTYMTPNAVSWWLCPVEDHQETYSQRAALFNPWTTVPNSPPLQTSLCSFVYSNYCKMSMGIFCPLKEILMSFSQLTVWEAWYKYI